MALLSSILTFIFITIVSVTGVYILTGLTGMFSLGQASFMALGSYVSAILVTKLGVPFVPACTIAVIVSVLIGFIVGLPTVRLRRDYISLVTLGFGEAITALLNQFTSLTGGASGYTGIPKITNLTIAGVSAFVCIALAAYFKNSKYGRQCIAVRNDELAAKAMGINAPRVKMIAFLTSVAVTAFSGCLYAFFTTYVDPTLFGWKKSADWIIMVFFGGSNSLTGSILGTFLLSGMPEVMRVLSEYRSVVYAVLVLLIINFKPTGLLGEWELTIKNLKALFSHKKPNDDGTISADTSEESNNDVAVRS
ncbi:MAG: branched-chain amino acid ABC transporter permease [Anaerolineaceae bacterium]|nr:branched-chain amino acid ABC transporter permease [Anaerolineaceae bacterium]